MPPAGLMLPRGCAAPLPGMAQCPPPGSLPAAWASCLGGAPCLAPPPVSGTARPAMPRLAR